jgi:Rieske Fe-S protein
MKRRSLINIFLGGSLIATVSAFLYPVVRYIIPPKQSKAGTGSVLVGKLSEMAPNTSKIFKFGSIPGILIYTRDGELLAFEAVCTHLSCNVIYESDTESLLCPCHNGRYDLNGQVLSGPPPSPLTALEVKTVGDDIIVSKKS